MSPPRSDFDDVAKLLRAFRRLIDAGHSLLVIEHNLDVVRAADWIIDLGPEGGDAGGAIVCVGTPAEVMRVSASHTGRALVEAESPAAFGNAVHDAEIRVAAPSAIEIRGARDTISRASTSISGSISSRSSPAYPAAARVAWRSTSCSPKDSDAILSP